MFFYELHEGDDEVYSDVLVVSESEWEPQEFFELVQRDPPRRPAWVRAGHADRGDRARARARLRFIYVNDDRLAAAVNVSTQDGDNFLADLEAEMDDDDDDDDEDRTRRSRTSSGPSSPTSIRTSAGRTRVARRTASQRLKRISSTSPSFTL